MHHNAGRPLQGSSRCLTSPAPSRSPRLPVCTAKKDSSPWSTGPGARRSSSGSSNSGKGSKGGGSSRGSNRASSGSSSKGSKASKAPSGQGFAPQKPQNPKPLVYKLTAPLTPQLLDELSGWEVVPAPLWRTFTGHCEGEWLGQYAAYTPYGGDPEPVWADESGAYLLYAYSRASEAREQVALGAALTAAAAEGAAAGRAATDELDTDTDEAGVADDVSDDMIDMLVRRTLRSASISSLIGGTTASQAAAAVTAEATGVAPAAGKAAAAAAAEDDDTDGFAYNRDGSVVFNGGSYSVGPETLGAPMLEGSVSADALQRGGADLAELPFTTVVVEQCVVSGGDTRLRLVATLKLRQPPGDDQELDVEVARLLLYKEFWYGTTASANGLRRKQPLLLQQQQQQQQEQQQAVDAGSSSSSSDYGGGAQVLQLLPSHKFDVPVISMPRPQPRDAAGSWNVFLVAASPIVEENPDTLQDEEVLVYSSKEERQQWHVPGLTSSAALGSSSSSSNGANGTGSSNGSGQDSSSSGEDAALVAAAAAAAAEQLDDDGSGGSFWLPGGAVVTIKMVQWPPGSAGLRTSSSSSSNSSSSNGNGNSSGSTRGLQIGLHWLVDGGSCLFVERQYDGEGQLAEVRHGTAVKGGWSGGRM